VISCGITSVYVASRSLTAMADMNIIHPFFGKKDDQGRPWVAMAISLGLGGGLCYLNVSSVGTVVYGWFSSLVSTCSCIHTHHFLATRSLHGSDSLSTKPPYLHHDRRLS
jgi:amino acid permease